MVQNACVFRQFLLVDHSIHYSGKRNVQFVGILDSEADSQAALRIRVNKQDSVSFVCEAHTEIEGSSCLSDPAFLVRDGNHMTVVHGDSSFPYLAGQLRHVRTAVFVLNSPCGISNVA